MSPIHRYKLLWLNQILCYSTFLVRVYISFFSPVSFFCKFSFLIYFVRLDRLCFLFLCCGLGIVLLFWCCFFFNLPEIGGQEFVKDAYFHGFLYCKLTRNTTVPTLCMTHSIRCLHNNIHFLDICHCHSNKLQPRTSHGNILRWDIIII